MSSVHGQLSARAVLRLLPLLLLGLLPSCLASDPGPEPVESAAAKEALVKLRARYRVKAKRERAEDVPALPASVASFEREGDRLLRIVEGETAEVDFPVQSTGTLKLRAKASGLAVEAALVDARPAPAETADGYVVYRGGGPSESTLLHRPTADGTEDYLAFERRPATESIEYDVTLSREVAGLRLVANTLEFLDRSGDPKLRIAPPYLVDAESRRVAANLTVRGCAVDTDPALPWGREPTPAGASRCTVRVDWHGMDVTYPALLDPSWSTTGDMVSARYMFPAVRLNDGRVYVSGGYGPDHVAIPQAEVYDPTFGSWAVATNLPARRAEHTATLLSDGRVLVAGGFDDDAEATNTAWLYSVSTNSYAPAGTLTTTRAKHTATLLSDGRVLLAGGRDFTGATHWSAERYTLGSGFAATGGMLAALADHRAVRLSNGEVLVVGFSERAQIYSPSGSWRNTGGLAVPRFAGALTDLTDGRVVYSGGDTGAGPSATVEVYTTATGTWERTGSLWYPHAHHTATRASNGRVFVLGGHLGDVTANGSVEVFNPTWGTWAPGPSMFTPRAGHAAVTLGDGNVLVVGGSPFVFAPPTNDAMLLGTSVVAVTQSEYRLPLAEDPLVLPTRVTELWGRLYRPSLLIPGRRYPLVLFLHGHHKVCSGGGSYVPGSWCPAGQTEVRNHAGYGYLAEELAANGYFVVSINANRINDVNFAGPTGDLKFIQSRGALVLRHLQKLSEWNRGVSTPPSSLGVSLRNRLAFNQVGLVGHSRGGEAMRAAYTTYRTSSSWRSRIGDAVNIAGIFEIAGTDTLSPPVDAHGTAWVTLLPMCDADVRMDGIHVFDRMTKPTFESVKFKASYAVWGAKHNPYNLEWVASAEPGDCIGEGNRTLGSVEQRQTALQPVLAFFLANVAASTPSFNQWLDPAFRAIASPNIDRGYITSANPLQNFVLEDFSQPTGFSAWGFANETSGVTVEHGPVPFHNRDLATTYRGGRIFWWGASDSHYFELDFFQNFDLRAFSYLDMRLVRTDLDPRDTEIGSWLNPVEPTNFEVRLVNNDGSLSGPLEIASYGKLDGPVGVNVRTIGSLIDVYPLLETVRLPLSGFSGATLSGIRGIRLTFSKTTSGDIYVGAISAALP